MCPPFLHLPTTQLGEAVEKDQEFWNHGTWREEEEADEDYTFEDQLFSSLMVSNKIKCLKMTPK
jgi:hypothetical protein